MFEKVLIANRGAIACRIIRTLRRMGVRSVAVYSDADRRSLHVEQAEQAGLINPRPPRKAHLIGTRITRCGAANRSAGDPSWLWVSQRKRRLRGSLRGEGHRVHRAYSGADARFRFEAHGAADCGGDWRPVAARNGICSASVS